MLLLPLWMDAVQKSISKKSLRKERSESKGNRACLNIFLLNLNRSFAVSCAQLGCFFFLLSCSSPLHNFHMKNSSDSEIFFPPCAFSRSFEFNSEWTWVSFRSYIPKAHAEWPSNYLIKLPCSASNIFYFTFCYTNLPSVWWMSSIFLRYLSPLELDIDWRNSSQLCPTVWNSRHRKKIPTSCNCWVWPELSQDKTRRVVAVVVALQLTSIHRSAAINLVNNRTIFQPLKLWKWFSFNSWLPLFVARGITLIPAWYPSHVSMQRERMQGP